MPSKYKYGLYQNYTLNVYVIFFLRLCIPVILIKHISKTNILRVSIITIKWSLTKKKRNKHAYTHRYISKNTYICVFII